MRTASRMKSLRNTKYENEVERFVAALQTMIAKLHDEGHLDVAGLAQFGRTLKEKPSP